MATKELRRDIFDNPGMAGRKHSYNQEVLKKIRQGEERIKGLRRSQKPMDTVVLPSKKTKLVNS